MTIDSLRSFRVGGFAVLDFVATYVLLLILGPLFSWLLKKIGIIVPLWSWLLWALPLGVLAHVIFRSFTPLTKMFLDPSGHWLVKVIIVVMVIAGFFGVRYE